MIGDMPERIRIAAPPRPGRFQLQIFAQQLLAKLRQIGRKGGGFEQSRAQRIRHGDVAAPDGMHQSRHAQERIGPQFEGVAEVVIESAEDHFHRLQSAEHLQVNAIVAYRQIAAFHQGVTEITRQVGVLEIGLVVGAGGQQHDARVVFVPRGQGLQAFAERLEEWGQPLHPAIAERFGQRPRHHDAIFEGVAGAGRRLGAIREYPPTTVGAAAEVGGVQMQIAARRHTQAMNGSQKSGIGKDQLRW